MPGRNKRSDLVNLTFAIVRIFSMVIFVALVITASAGGRYRDGIVMVMKYISAIPDQVVVQKLHRVVAQDPGDHIAVLVNLGQAGVLTRILAGPTNVARLVRLTQVVDRVMQGLPP